MDVAIDRGRRTRRLLVLGISVAMLGALWVYANSLEHWGDTRAVVFTVAGVALAAIGLGALVLLITDLVRGLGNAPPLRLRDASMSTHERSSMPRFRALWSRTRFLRAAVAAGAVGGLVAGGISGRLVMRLVALIDGETDGRLTDSGATVGEVTVRGTLQLFLVTTIAGVVGGLLYRSIRRWIPATHVPKGLVFGLLVMIVPGIIVFNPDNPDFQLFEPVLLFQALFVGIFLLYGMIVAAVAEVLDPAPVRASSPSHARRAIAREVAVLLVLVGLHLFIAGGMLEVEGTCLAVDGKGGCALRPTSDDDGT